MPPVRYLYLVDAETGEPMVVFPIDHLTGEREVLVYEAELRVQHDVDDQESGLRLKDSLLDPLPDATLRDLSRAPERSLRRVQHKWTPH